MSFRTMIALSGSIAIASLAVANDQPADPVVQPGVISTAGSCGRLRRDRSLRRQR